VLLCSAALRLAVAASTPFGTDEAYAVAVATPLQLSYFDHPPAVFWLAAAMEALTGLRDPLWIRLPFVLLFTGTTALVARLGDLLFGRPVGWWSAVVISVTGVIGVTGGSWVLPDGPLFFAMALGSWAAAQAIFVHAATPRTAFRWWILVGIAGAIGALSKYHAIFLPLGVALFVIGSRSHRHLLATAGPWLATAIAAMGTLPVLLWNAQHDWISLRFQGARATPGGDWSIAPFAENVAGQFGYLLPWVAPVIGWALWRVLRSVPDQRHRFVLCIGLGPVLLFTLSTLLGRRGLPHWQAPGYLLLAVLVGEQLAARATRARWPTRWALSASVITATVAIMLAIVIRTGWLIDRLPRDPATEALSWDEVAGVVHALRLHDGASTVSYVATDHWMHGAKLGAALGHDVPVLVLSDDARHFQIAAPPARWRGRDGLFVRIAPGTAAPLDPAQRAHFRTVWRLPDVIIRRSGRPALRVECYRVRGLETTRGPSLVVDDRSVVDQQLLAGRNVPEGLEVLPVLE
jgi:hypothetical protein